MTSSFLEVFIALFRPDSTFPSFVHSGTAQYTPHPPTPPAPSFEVPRSGRGIVYLSVTGEAFCPSLTNDLLCGYAGN